MRWTRSRTGAWRCEVPISSDCSASFASASGRTFEGPQPKRPSPGFRSAGIATMVSVVVIGATGYSPEPVDRGRAPG